MKMRFVAPVVSFTVLLCSCSESLRLKSAPPGASIYINDEAVGDTPVTFWTPPFASMHGPWRYRVEYKGTAIGSGEIATRVSRGRITGAVFTVGTLLLFRSPRVFIADDILFKFFPPSGSPPTYFGDPGTGSIAGQAFAVTRGDDVKPAAGRTVALHPDCPPIRDYYASLTSENTNRDYVAVSPPPEDFTKTTVADATGSFQFEGLAPGRYVLATSVNWTHFSGFNYTRLGAFGWVDLQWATEGGLIVQAVEVKEGRPTKVVMTR